MKKLDNKAVIDLVTRAGISANKIGKVVGTISISLARQASKKPDKTININMATRSELKESLRIGADLSLHEADTLLDNIEKILKAQNEPVIEFLEEGKFKVDEGEIKFKLNSD